MLLLCYVIFMVCVLISNFGGFYYFLYILTYPRINILGEMADTKWRIRVSPYRVPVSVSAYPDNIAPESCVFSLHDRHARNNLKLTSSLSYLHSRGHRWWPSSSTSTCYSATCGLARPHPYGCRPGGQEWAFSVGHNAGDDARHRWALGSGGHWAD